MNIVVKLFGAESRSVGAPSVTVNIDGADCTALRAALERDVPALRPFLANARFAVNHEFAAPEQQLRETDEIALIGMVSGG